jgi:TolA-binding protein
MAAGQTLCLTGAGGQVRAPQSNGQCKSGETAVTLSSQADLSALQGQVSTLQGQVGTLQGQVSSLQGQVSSLQSDNTTLKSSVSDLQTKLSKVSYSDSGLNGLPTLTIAGANLQIDSGAGSTYGPVNGLGNLIIGYDESPGTQTGSNNLVIGTSQQFTSYGGLIAGNGNVLSGANSDVFGSYNTASGDTSSVGGGRYNNASAATASVSGGFKNTASALTASVSGGFNNTASGNDSSVSGGETNTASGEASSILGGYGVTVSTLDGTSPTSP